MADAKITLDADTAAMVAKLTRAGDRVKEVGRQAGDALGKGIARGVESGTTAALIKVGLLHKAVSTVIQAIEEVGRKSADASRTVGGRAVSLTTSLAPLGITDLPSFNRQLETTK